MTAVEWLIEQIKDDHNQKALSAKEWLEAIEEAKEMHKQEIKDAYVKGREEHYLDWYPQKHSEEYCQETFVSKGSNEVGNAKKVLSQLKEFRDSLTDEEKKNMFKDDHIVDTNKMVDQVPDVKKMDDDEIKSLKITLDKVAHYRMGYNRAKSTLYTEEQVREVIRNCFKSNSIGFLITEDDMIRTIKQPKK